MQHRCASCYAQLQGYNITGIGISDGICSKCVKIEIDNLFIGMKHAREKIEHINELIEKKKEIKVKNTQRSKPKQLGDRI